MSYIENNLMDEENVLYRAHLHSIVFLWPVVWLLVATFYLALGNGTASLGWLLIAIATGVAPLMKYMTAEFGVTNKRVITTVGFIRRKLLEVPLHKVEGIQVSQGFLGRLLGFGAITVSGSSGNLGRVRVRCELAQVAQSGRLV